MNTFNFVLLIVLFGIIYFAITASVVHIRLRRYRKEYDTERTRAHWAESRHLLFDLVRQGKVSPESATFRRVYHLQTFILRRPEAYRRISEMMAEAFLSSSPGEPGPSWMRDEMATWPKEMQEVFRHMAKGTASLIFMHHGWKKLLFPSIAMLARIAPRRLMDRIMKPLESTFTLDRASSRLGQLAHAG